VVVKELNDLPSLIENVIRDLEIARERFDADEASHGRFGVLTALDAFNRLGTALLANRAAELLAPIRNLQHALIDAERGKRHPLFNPKEHVGRPPDRTEHLGLAGIAAVLMQLLMNAGKSKSDAGRQVARRLNAIGHRTPQGATISGKLIMEWRDRAMTERPVEDIVADRYVRMLQEVEMRFPGDPKSAFKHMLENLPAPLPVRLARPEKSD
jgi:hypothetical protein